MNGDGRLDLVMGQSDSVVVMLGDGSGLFTAQVSVAVPSSLNVDFALDRHRGTSGRVNTSNRAKPVPISDRGAHRPLSPTRSGACFVGL
jgi:hypothetical protein